MKIVVVERSRHGSSIAAIFAGLGPRIALAPPDEGGAPAGDSGSGGPAPAPEPATPTPEGEKPPSALAEASAKAAETKPSTEPGSEKKTEGADKVKGDEPAKPPADPEKKPAEGEPAQAADAVAKDVDGNPVPDAYDIKMPDGMKMDDATMAAAAPVFKDAKLSPAQAQAVTDIYVKVQSEAIQKHNEMVNGWLDESKKDPEIGGAKYDQNIAKAGEAFQAFGSERLGQILDTYGLGNNPEVLRVFARIGNAMGEGSTVLANGGTGRVTDAQAFYPEMTKR